jgi:nitrous oxidase accessory protein NosD
MPAAPATIRPGDSAALAIAVSVKDAVVAIPTGDYTGPFQIAQDVSLVPVSGATVRLLPGPRGGVAAYANGPGISIEGIEIAGLHLLEGAEVRLLRCRIHDSPAEGLVVPTRARLDITDSEIARSAGISVHLNGGEAALRQCRILDGKTLGLVFSAGSRGTVTGCHISGHNHIAQVMIWNRSAPVLRDCTIQDGKGHGILARENARPRLEHCRITRHGGISFFADTNAEPTLLECKIGPGEQNGIFINKNATLQAERCELTGHGVKFAQILLSQGGTASLTDLHLRDGRGPGVFLEHGAEARLKKCHFENHDGPAVYAAASKVFLEACHIGKGAHHGLMFRQKAEASVEKCTFEGQPPSFAAAYAESDATLTIRHCKLAGGGGHGIRVSAAQARLEDTEITGVAGSGVFCEQKARVFLRGCKVHACIRNSLVLLTESQGTIDDSDFIGAHDDYPLLLIGSKSHLAMRASRINQSGSAGLWYDQATGSIENTTIESTHTGLGVFNAAAPRLTACTIRGQKLAIKLAPDGGGIFKQCAFHSASAAIVSIAPSSPATFENCTANDKPWQRPTPAPAALQPSSPPSELQTLLARLNSLIGLDAVKQKVSEATSTARAMRARQLQGLPVVSISYHTVFTGNPGTGKTTVARLMGALYKAIGVLPSGHLVECDRSKLVAEFIGQTAIKTNQIIDKALGGILFIDEAYTLASGGPNDYGKEAIDTLLKRMEDDRDKFIVIAAGYPGDMEAFLKSNTGFRSRFRQFIDFPDYTPQELLAIFLAIAKKTGTTLTPALQQRLASHLTHLHAHRDDTYANARTVDNLFQKIVGNQARRIDPSTATREQLATLDAPDLPNTP